MEVYGLIRVEMPLELKTITCLEYSQRAGRHVWLKIGGVVEESMAEAVSRLNADSSIKVYIIDGNREQTLFAGIPVSVKMEYGQRMEVLIEAASRTILLDIEKKSRSFQRETMKYTTLMEEIVREAGGDFMVKEKRTDEISAPFLQYEETDWQFMNRLASRYGCSLFASATGEKPQIYLGVGSGEAKAMPSASWQFKKQIAEYMKFRQRAETMEQAFLTCQVTDTQKHELGEGLTCSGVSFRITGIRGKLEGGSLLYTYELTPKQGACVEEQKNKRLQGHTLPGTILLVKENQVKIHLEIDKKQEKGEAYWYPIHRTDWYCMPEKGSRAVLYFPSDDEAEAYVTAIQRTDGRDNPKAQNPKDCYMQTAEGKGAKISPDSIGIYGDEKRVWMKLTEKKGLQVKSRRGIHLEAGGSFKCHGKSITLESGEQILMETDRTMIILDDIVQIRG